MKRRRRKILLRWSEPARLQRPPLRRERKRARPLLIRMVIWGAALSALMQVIVMLYVPGIIPTAVLIKAYAAVTIGLPAMLLLYACLHRLFPRSIAIHPKRFSIVHGQSARTIESDRIISWRFATLPNAASDAVIRITYTRKNGQRDKRTIGLAPRLDLIDVDRALRRMVRFARLKNLQTSARP